MLLNVTFGDFVELMWKNNLRRRQVKPSTLASYASMLEHHVYPFVASERVRDMTPPHVEMLLSSIQNYSPKYQRNVALLLRGIFNHAVENGVIDRSPMRDYHMPRVSQKEKHSWNEDEVKQILDTVPVEYKPLFATVAFTGMRIGEVLGMVWGQVDFRKGWIKVNQALWNGRVFKPKTDASLRVIPMGPGLYRLLQEHKESELKRWSVQDDGWGRAKKTVELKHDDFVFRSRFGKPFCANVLRRDVLYRTLDRLGLDWKEREGGFHRFRHSAGSIVVSKTGNLKHAQKLLGHSSITTTAHIYTHVSAEEIRKSVVALEDAILNGSE